ncbi:hypothetical protein AB5J62_43820 [Amycolatopsis sp. cg5]|uniref:hypothetical protein n=1 Tax=Amycolatopsis sp. cg5 TaxID=3238802 RepID=UPI0035235BC1
MPVPAGGKDPLKLAKEAARGLHKALGVRKPGIRKKLGAELCALWGIDDGDSIEVVRAKIVIRLEDVLGVIRDEQMTLAIKTAFNFSLDEEVSALQYGGRCAWLQSQGGKGLSTRNVPRLLDDFFAELDRSLDSPLAPVPDGRIRQVVAREGRNPTWEDAAGLDGKVRGLWEPKDPAGEAIDAFIDASVYEPRTLDNRPAIVSVPESGAWLCVFGDQRRLDVYRHVVRPPWSDAVAIKRGADIVLGMTRASRHAGIVLNPSPQLGQIALDVLVLPRELVAELAGRL